MTKRAKLVKRSGSGDTSKSNYNLYVRVASQEI
jgi:hypothetical protein